LTEFLGTLRNFDAVFGHITGFGDNLSSQNEENDADEKDDGDYPDFFHSILILFIKHNFPLLKIWINYIQLVVFGEVEYFDEYGSVSEYWALSNYFFKCEARLLFVSSVLEIENFHFLSLLPRHASLNMLIHFAFRGSSYLSSNNQS
jgi:hypothetical protein